MVELLTLNCIVADTIPFDLHLNIKTNLSLILVPIYRYSITSSHFIDSTLVSIILK